jgi:TrmH family RNA methyltransferase
MTIQSAQNPKVKLVRHLIGSSKSRRERDLFVLEGTRLILDVIEQGHKPAFILYRPEMADSIAPLMDKVDCEEVEARALENLSDTEHSQGLLAVFNIPKLELPAKASLILALDGLNDPGNLGTILRTAAAAGVDGLLLMPGTVDPYNPKVVRAGMGAHFRLPIIPMEWALLPKRFGKQWQTLLADLPQATSQPYDQQAWDKPTVLIIGNEAHGLSVYARQMSQQQVHIPMVNGVESLNSAIASAVILFEVQRQRRASLG